jgi:hypothetical protein
VQREPIKPKLKPPITKRLKLKCDVLLSTSAFKFILRCYNAGPILLCFALFLLILFVVRRCILGNPRLQARNNTSFALGLLTRCPCVLLCNLTTCYSIECAWFQRLK